MDTAVFELAERQATMCRVFGHSRRLLILWLLSEGELSVNEIASHVGSTLQNISQHLTLLKKTGIVAARREGQTIYYRITDYGCTLSCPALSRPADVHRFHSIKKENI